MFRETESLRNRYFSVFILERNCVIDCFNVQVISFPLIKVYFPKGVVIFKCNLYCIYRLQNFVSKSFDNTLNRICSFGHHRGRCGRFERFAKKPPDAEKLKWKLKSSWRHYLAVPAPTLVITKFHLYLVQLWWSFSYSFVNCGLVDSQTWAVLLVKYPVEPPYRWRVSSNFFKSEKPG